MAGFASLMQRLVAVETAVAAEIAAQPPCPFRHMSDREEAAVKRTIRTYESATTPEQRFADYLNGTNARTNLLPSGEGISESVTERDAQEIYESERMKPWPRKRKFNL